MALSKVRPRTVYCPCGKAIGNERWADGYRRCTWCVEDFARRTVPKVRKVQTTPPAVLPAAAPATTAAEAEATRTALYVRTLREARERADRDLRGARFRELRAAGMSIEDAIKQVEGEDPNGKEDDDR